MNFVTRHLLIGDIAEANNEKLLKRFKIRAVVNCSNTSPLPEFYQRLGIATLWIPFDDGEAFGRGMHPRIKRAFIFVKRHIQHRKNVLVHCRAGVSRSSAFTISYLYWSGAARSFDKAFDRVRRVHPIALPHYLVLSSFKELLGLAVNREEYEEFWLKEMAKRGYL